MVVTWCEGWYSEQQIQVERSIVRASLQPNLQTRCRGETARIMPLIARGRELFLIFRVYRCLLFSFNLLTIAVSSQFTVRLFYAHFHSLLSSLGGITRFIDLQMRGFSSFPQFWLLRCSWGQWVILLQYGCGVGDISAVVILSCWILYSVCGPGICTSTQ